MPTIKPKILIIEDDPALCEAFTSLLEPAYIVESVGNGLTGLKAALRNPPDLILLDLKMPTMDGFQTCQLLRADSEFDDIEIIVISGFGGADDRVRALESGADDFISKPVDGLELLARIKRRLAEKVSKENVSNSRHGVIRCGDLRIELTEQLVYIGEKRIHFSQIEFRLLYLLASHFGEAVSRELIIEKVWDNHAISSRVIDPHIVSIRNKLKPSRVSISSIYGKGYALKLQGN